MLKAKHHWFIYPFFQYYAKWMINRYFRFVHYEAHDVLQAIRSDKPLMVIANHSSWWDGFWVLLMNQLFFKKLFHVVIEEKQLLKYTYFRKTGGFSLKQEKESLRDTLSYACNILSDSRNLLLVFPSGVLDSMHNRNIVYKKGVQYLFDHSECDLLMVNNIVDYGAHKRPALFVYSQLYYRDSSQPLNLVDGFEKFLEESRRKHINGKVWH